MSDHPTYHSILSSISAFGNSKKDDKKTIALKIKAYRAQNNLTQEELARKLEVTRMQIVRWETAKNKPSKVFMKQLKDQNIL